MYGSDGVQIPPANISGTMSSILNWGNGTVFNISLCNPGSNVGRGFPYFCHTNFGDPKPSINFTYPCSLGLTRVRIANNIDK